MKSLIIFLAAAAFATTVSANSACDKPRDDFDGLYCLNKVYLEADAELNANYKKLVQKLDTQGAGALKKGQLQWLDERNARCSKRDGDGFFVNLNCATRKTIDRVQFLQDRYRECVSSGCQNSKL
ncbi:MAG: lysozyme inhibitor LprI family protein [Betaproteobacteria bacterium]